MTHPALSLDIRRIVTDSDLDGVVTGAILRRWWKEAEVVFGHQEHFGLECWTM